jgi:hypothetical protein
MTDRFVLACGKPEAVVSSDLPPEDSSAQEPPTDFASETETALRGIAEARGLDLSEFADA